MIVISSTLATSSALSHSISDTTLSRLCLPKPTWFTAFVSYSGVRSRSNLDDCRQLLLYNILRIGYFLESVPLVSSDIFHYVFQDNFINHKTPTDIMTISTLMSHAIPHVVLRRCIPSRHPYIMGVKQTTPTQFCFSVTNSHTICFLLYRFFYLHSNLWPSRTEASTSIKKEHLFV